MTQDAESSKVADASKEDGLDRCAAQVVYPLSTLIAAVDPDVEATRNARHNRGTLLAAGFGTPLKNVVKACKAEGARRVCVTGTADKESAFAFSGYAHVVDLGKRFDERLFSNEHALIQAAIACHAYVMLVCDPAACTDLLLKAAYEEGVLVFTPLSSDKSLRSWVLRESPEQQGQRHEMSMQRAAGEVDASQGVSRAEDPRRTIRWRACPKCKLSHDWDAVMAHDGVCPTCGELYRYNSDERIAATFDEGSFQEWDRVVAEPDPLAFPGYPDKMAGMREKSGLQEAVRCGKASLEGIDVALCVMESTFMMGSMGWVVGEKITRTVERATQEGLPLVIFAASGGARMQEGLVSLMQMAKVSAAIERHGRAGLPYVSVITDPTTGGVTASFAMEGDVIVSEPHALIGFAGRRVIEDTIRQTLPPGFQTAEFALEHGLIDTIVERPDLPAFLAQVISVYLAAPRCRSSVREKLAARASAVRESALPAVGLAPVGRDASKDEGLQERVRAPFYAIAKRVRETFRGPEDPAAAMEREMLKRDVADARGVKPLAKLDDDSDPERNRAWESVQLARNVHRPTASYYIDAMVDGFIELHGDRMFADDGAIMAGLGWIEGMPVMVVAEEKGRNLEQRIARNFGCPQPEGYRKSLRLMRQAEKFGLPIVCLVDTQGAFCGMEAEERGQGNAIADNLVALSGLGVPVVSVVLGEGGSGGALALAVGNRVAMQKHAVYSVLSPEGFASILWKDRSRAAEAAAVMKMSADEACQLGIIEAVLSEGDGPAHVNPAQAARNVRDFVVASLHELEGLDEEELRQQRYERFRAL